MDIGENTLLVADDNPPVRELITRWLSEEGYQVIAATDGEEALACFRDHPIDLAVMDVLMPRKSGFEFCRAIKSDPKTRLVPVVLVTALSEACDRLRGIECGADDFLTKPVNKAELLARVRSLLRLKHFTDELENAETVLYTLARSIEAKDPYTEGHCERLSHYGVALATQLGLTEEQQMALRRAGIVHDIGKVVVPDHILLKPGPLTAEERRVMQQHPIAGERICAPMKSFRHVLPIIRHHHEHQDGSGYPDGLRGDEIPITARILQTADVYDALTTERPYRRALPAAAALKIMHEEAQRGWWDPHLRQELERMIQHGALAVPPQPAQRRGKTAGKSSVA